MVQIGVLAVYLGVPLNYPTSFLSPSNNPKGDSGGDFGHGKAKKKKILSHLAKKFFFLYRYEEDLPWPRSLTHPSKLSAEETEENETGKRRQQQQQRAAV